MRFFKICRLTCLLLVFFSVSGQASKLGSRLFFDPRLSGDSKTMCASCHQPSKMWGDAAPTPPRFLNVSRNSQSLINLSVYRHYFWDGRVGSLAEQALIPLHSTDEMASSAEKITRLIFSDTQLLEQYIKEYRCSGLRDQHTAKPCAPEYLADDQNIDNLLVTYNVADSLARFQMRIISRPEPAKVWSPARTVFEKKKCSTCHSGEYLTNGELVKIMPHKILPEPVEDQTNRAALVADVRKRFANYLGTPSEPASLMTGYFRVPSLWNISLTAPYFHDGSAATLRDVLSQTAGLNGDEQEALATYLMNLVDRRLNDRGRNGYLLLEGE